MHCQIEIAAENLIQFFCRMSVGQYATAWLVRAHSYHFRNRIGPPVRLNVQHCMYKQKNMNKLSHTWSKNQSLSFYFLIWRKTDPHSRKDLQAATRAKRQAENLFQFKKTSGSMVFKVERRFKSKESAKVKCLDQSGSRIECASLKLKKIL